MKNLILMLLVVVSLDFAGSPQLKSRTFFNFGGISDNALTMTEFRDGSILVGGIYSAHDGSKSGLTLIDISGKQNWIVLDTSPSTSSISIGKNSEIYWSTFTGFLKKSDDSGKVLWNKKIADTWVYVFCNHGLPAVSIGGSSPKILFLDENGEQTDQMDIPANTTQGAWLPRLHGQKLWLFGTPNSKPGPAVIVVDMESGEKMWEKYFPLNVRTTGTVDANGNGYLVATRFISDPLATEFAVTKLDSAGNQLWQKIWSGRQTSETNLENYVNGTTVSLEKNLVVIMGSIQKGDSHTGSKSAYLVGLNATNGNSEWSKVVDYRGGYLESSRAGFFTDSGKLVVLSLSVSNLDFNPPNLLYLDTYEVDKVLGIENPQTLSPAEFRLEQNYPNPFNPNTKIRYSVPNRQYVNLTVYDLLSREITVLVNGETEAGSHEVNFNAVGLPSGTYLYRLQTANKVETRKMSLVK